MILEKFRMYLEAIDVLSPEKRKEILAKLAEQYADIETVEEMADEIMKKYPDAFRALASGNDGHKDDSVIE